jgi:phytanoyl-CoA hydroxylase
MPISTNMPLNDQQLDFYDQNGYLVIKGYFSHHETEQLKRRMTELLDHISLEHQAIFSTNRQVQATDEYFLESGDQIRCFFEEKKINHGAGPVENKRLSINKVGHAMHDLDEGFRHFSYRPALMQMAIQLGLRIPAIIQSQYIFKPPFIGGNVSPHTDSTFLYTEPLSCLGAWFALDDATTENGCLWALPGSHWLPITRRFVRTEDGKSTKFIQINPENEKWDLEKFVPLEAEKGDLVILHGSVVHMSYANTSPHARPAYVLHLIDQKTNWLADNWLQRSPDFPLKSMSEILKQP